MAPTFPAGADHAGILATLRTPQVDRRRPVPELDLGLRLASRMLDGAQDHVTIRDVVGRHVYVNRAAANWLGLPAEAILGRTTTELVPGARADTIERRDRELVRSGIRTELEETLTRDGVTRTWLTTMELIRDARGMAIAIGTVSRDITERVAAAAAVARADEARNESARLLTGILDSMSDHICMRAMDDRYVLVNRAMADWYGRQADEMIGQTCDQLFGAELTAVIAARDAEILATGGPIAYEETLTNGGVTRTWLSTRDLVRNSSGRAIAHLAVSRDITDLRRVEGQFHEAQKMEAIGRLAGGVAHDFNNLLTVISGNVEILLGDIGNHPGRAAAEEIATAADRAAMVTRQLLAFSRRQVLAPEVLDVRSVIADMVPLVRRLVGASIVIESRVEDRPGLVRVDRTQLEQVLINLAINGRDAMQSGGTLTISLATVELDAAETRLHQGVSPGPYVELAVADSGVGIEADVRARIFEPFFTTKEPGKGTGLGLSMVEGVVRQSGGDVWVDSEPGCGTTFRVFLPRVAGPEAVDPPRPAAVPAADRAGTILVVEDEPGVREISRRMLASAGYTVLTAADPAEAFAIIDARAAEIDLLLTDVVMPGGTGPDVARALAQRNPAAPVVYMSGYTNDVISVRGGLAPEVTLVAKPFSSEQLRAAIRAAMAAPPSVAPAQ